MLTDPDYINSYPACMIPDGMLNYAGILDAIKYLIEFILDLIVSRTCRDEKELEAFEHNIHLAVAEQTTTHKVRPLSINNLTNFSGWKC